VHLHAFYKRCFDFCAAALVLLLLLPVLIAIAFAVAMDSRGSIFFSHERIGRNGERFRIFKFRSMYPGSPSYQRSPTDRLDPRITRVGRVLRRLSLDELPQLLNVLRGEMSLVGPRPEMPFMVAKYTSEQRRRLHAVPGITGLWQISPARALPIHENLQYDLYYIEHAPGC
jgi:lipopolysaccharide/colanic/teichoic acid biosynthesis glycosyltransferase